MSSREPAVLTSENVVSAVIFRAEVSAIARAVQASMKEYLYGLSDSIEDQLVLASEMLRSMGSEHDGHDHPRRSKRSARGH